MAALVVTLDASQVFAVLNLQLRHFILQRRLSHLEGILKVVILLVKCEPNLFNPRLQGPILLNENLSLSFDLCLFYIGISSICLFFLLDWCFYSTHRPRHLIRQLSMKHLPLSLQTHYLFSLLEHVLRVVDPALG